MLFYFSEHLGDTFARQKISSDSFIPSSLLYRINHGWSDSLALIYQRPLIGIGPGALNVVTNADNDFLDKTVRYGVVGGIFYFLVLFSFIITPLLSLRKSPTKFISALYKNAAWLGVFLFLGSTIGSFLSADRFIAFYFILYFLPYLHRKHVL